MKKTFAFIALFVGFASITNAQTLLSTRTASLMTGDYATQGTVHLESYDNGTLDLRFENDYMTQSNVFDVHLFLSNSNNYTAPIDTTGMLLVENIGTINGINYSSGAMTFNLPNGVDINDYQYVVMVCVQFGRLHWADGTFGAEMSVANISEQEEVLDVQLSPNPTTDEVTIQTGFTNADIQLTALDGSVLLNATSQGFSQTISTSHLPSGVYLVHVKDEATNRSKTLRLLKD